MSALSLRGSTDDGHTIAIEPCAACPPLEEWPTQNLIVNQCPHCGASDDGAWRVAHARRLASDRTVGGKQER